MEPLELGKIRRDLRGQAVDGLIPTNGWRMKKTQAKNKQVIKLSESRRELFYFRLSSWWFFPTHPLEKYDRQNGNHFPK